MASIRLTGTVVILGASRGLGREISRRYRADNWSVVEVSRSCTDCAKAIGETVQCDLASNDSAARCARLIGALERIDRFFWVAGQMTHGTFAAASSADLTSCIDVNFRNPLEIVQAAWRKLLSSSTGGKMVIVASTAARNPKCGESVYCATKAAQAIFAQSISQEITNPKLSVGLIVPGGMKTGLWDGIDQRHFAAFSDPIKVARVICDEVENASGSYFEVEIPRGLV